MQNREYRKTRREIEKNLRSYNRLLPIDERVELRPFDFSTVLRQHFARLVDGNVICVLTAENQMLPAIVQSYLEKKRPFHDGKDSFKDAVIWFSYLPHMLLEPTAPKAFVSNNTTDWSGPNKDELHDDPKAAAPVTLSYYHSLRDLISKDPMIRDMIFDLETEEQRTEDQTWVSTNVTIEFLTNLFTDQFVDDVFKTLIEVCGELDSSRLGDWTSGGYVDYADDYQ